MSQLKVEEGQSRYLPELGGEMLAVSTVSSATQLGVTELPCRDLGVLEGQRIHCNRLDLFHSRLSK